jgi:hypothetical protein
VACILVVISEGLALNSAARLRRLSSPSTGYTTCRTVSSGRCSAASATFSSSDSLLVTRVNSAIICFMTFFSARNPIRCTVEISNRTN